MSDALTNAQRWDLGNWIESVRVRSNYGAGIMSRMASELGYQRADSVRELARLARLWSRERAELADEIGMPARSVAVLLTLEPTPNERHKAKTDKRLAKALQARVLQRGIFMRSFERGVKGPEFEEFVHMWKRTHLHYWTVGNGHRMRVKAKGACVFALRTAKKQVVRYLGMLPASQVPMAGRRMTKLVAAVDSTLEELK